MQEVQLTQTVLVPAIWSSLELYLFGTRRELSAGFARTITIA